jgi:hypothetical protein
VPQENTLPDVKFGLAISVYCVTLLAGGLCILVLKPIVSFLLLTYKRAVAGSLLFVVHQTATLAKEQCSVYIKSLVVYCF